MGRLLLLVLILVAMGCGASTKTITHPSRLFPVEGRLLVAGQPVAKAQVVFHPLGESVNRSVAMTDTEGRFRLMTHTAGDGAAAGEYAVTVFWENEADPLDSCLCPDPTTHDRFGGLYADANTSTLRAMVKPGRNEVTLFAEVGGRSWNLPRPNNVREPRRPSPRNERDWDRGDRPSR